MQLVYLTSQHDDLRQLDGVGSDGVEDILQLVDHWDERLHVGWLCGRLMLFRDELTRNEYGHK